MSAIGRFLAGLLIGIAVPLGVTLAWTKLSGTEPVIVVHGDVTGEQETILRSRVESLIEDSEVELSSSEVEAKIESIGWIDDAAVWRTLTNRLHIDIVNQTVVNSTRQSTEIETNSTFKNSDAAAVTPSIINDSTLKNIGSRVLEQGDVLENAFQTSEGLKIVLESGTSVLLGTRDLEERMNRFLAVYGELEGQTDLSRLVADARYDQGVAVVLVDDEDDSSFSNDDEIASGPLVITHE